MVTSFLVSGFSRQGRVHGLFKDAPAFLPLAFARLTFTRLIHTKWTLTEGRVGQC